MENEIINLCYKIRDLLKEEPSIVLLNKLDEQLNSNEEVMKLSYIKDLKSTQYSDLLKIYKDDSIKVKEARKALSEAKKNLDEHPLVKKYNKAYSEVNLLLYELNNILFNSFKKEGCK